MSEVLALTPRRLWFWIDVLSDLAKARKQESDDA